jgi:hypothetical protein
MNQANDGHRLVKLTLNCLFPHYWTKQRRTRDALGFFQALVKGRTEGTITAPDLGGYSEDGIKCPRASLL